VRKLLVVLLRDLVEKLAVDFVSCPCGHARLKKEGWAGGGGREVLFLFLFPQVRGPTHTVTWSQPSRPHANWSTTDYAQEDAHCLFCRLSSVCHRNRGKDVDSGFLSFTPMGARCPNADQWGHGVLVGAGLRYLSSKEPS
jgi:hypothetical protein